MVSTCGTVQHIGNTTLFSEGIINHLDVSITTLFGYWNGGQRFVRLLT
jgi:hypothetical protein